MSEKQPKNEIPKIKKVPEISAGILKEREREDLEDRIVETMKRLGSRLTKKEILALSQKIEVSKGLDELKRGLEAEAKLTKEIPDEVLAEIFRLIAEAREAAESGLKELKLEIVRTNRSKEYEINAATYPSHRFPWVKRLEETELGKSIVIDIEGFLVGAADSALAVVRLIVALLGDFALLPKHVYEHFRTPRNRK